MNERKSVKHLQLEETDLRILYRWSGLLGCSEADVFRQALRVFDAIDLSPKNVFALVAGARRKAEALVAAGNGEEEA